MDQAKRERGVQDDDELVDLCVDEYEGLRPAFELSSGTSMRAKHLRSYTEASLKTHVMSHGGPDGLVPPWLDANNLRSLLRDEGNPDQVKKLKVSDAVPPMVFGEGQSAKDFVRAITERPLTPIDWNGDNAGPDPHVSVISLPEHMTWLTIDSRNLFVRSRYEELWQLIEREFRVWREPAGGASNRNQRVLVLGNTGIGKTAALNYFLRRALEQAYRVLFETREMRYFFHDGTVEWEKLTATNLENHRFDRSVLLLVDHQQDRPPPFCNAFTVAPVSPDPANYKEFKKNRCLRLWMPVTTRSELIAMNAVEPQVSDSVLLERLEQFGPIPRLVFEKEPNQEAITADLEGKIKAFDFVKCRKSNMLHTGELPEEKDGLSWWILHVTTESLKVPGKIDWATCQIMHRVLQHFRGNRLRELESAIAAQLKQPGALHAPDGEFEYWSCHVLASGRRVDTSELYYEAGQCKLRPSPKQQIHLPASDVVLIRTIARVSELVKQPGKVFYSQLSNEPLCDAAAVHNNELLLFQMTIGQEHNFGKATWRSYCKGAKEAGLSCVRFVFVVPHSNNFRVSKDQVALFANANYDIPTVLEVAEMRPSE